jgi:glycosyltransferase involved in cell wall biosynthesis
MAAAETVVVGNNYLAQYARQFTQQVCVIPSVVDLSRYPTRKNASTSDTIVISWIGIPATADFLRPLVPVFHRLQQQFPRLAFRFIGTGSSFPADGLKAEFPPWSEQTEATLLGQCDIGIMPMPDTNFTRGKCGLKLIQYMASSLPVVASPVGVNREIIASGENGFLANSGEEWFATLSTLIQNPELRKQFGVAGRARVEERYSLERGFEKWSEILERATRPAHQHPIQSPAGQSRRSHDPITGSEE